MTYFKTVMTPSGETHHSIPQVQNNSLMLIARVLQEFQTLADHTQDVRNWNQGYQYISPILYFTRNLTC